MSAGEDTKDEAEGVSEETQAAARGAETPYAADEVPLFLRGRSDGPKGNAQDEKDEVGE